MNPDEVAYLAHFGVKGMKWGVHRSESHPNGVSGRQAVGVVPPSHNNVRGNYKARLASAQKRSISDAAAIRKRYEATSKVYDKEYEKARASGQGHIKAFKTANAATDKRRDSDAKAVVKVSASSVRNCASYVSAVRKGREFAEEMGLDTPTIIDETGRIIKNARPNFGYE